MIKVLVVKENNFVRKIRFLGHADYDDYGKDIVCAAVSATYLCSVNACYLFDEESILVKSDRLGQEIVMVSDNLDVQKILINMIHCLENLEKRYPKNIRIDKEEK